MFESCSGLCQGQTVPGIDQDVETVCVRDSIGTVAVVFIWTTDLPQIV